MSRQDEYVRCRTYGHAWYEIFPNLGPPPTGWRLCLRCERCGTVRHDIVGYAGDVQARYYDHPDDYKYSGTTGEDPWRRDEYRQELFKLIRGKLGKAKAVSDDNVVSMRRKAS